MPLSGEKSTQNGLTVRPTSSPKAKGGSFFLKTFLMMARFNLSHAPTIPFSGKLWTNLIAAFVALLLTSCHSPGSRLLDMEVYQNDQLVLRTMFDAPDYEAPAEFWRRAGMKPFAAQEPFARVKADGDNPLRASLTGVVRIKIIHAKQVMTSASLTNLVLLRSAPGSQEWYLAPDECKRAKRAAGL